MQGKLFIYVKNANLEHMRAEMSGYMHGDDGTIKQKTSACFFQILTLQIGYYLILIYNLSILSSH